MHAGLIELCAACRDARGAERGAARVGAPDQVPRGRGAERGRGRGPRVHHGHRGVGRSAAPARGAPRGHVRDRGRVAGAGGEPRRRHLPNRGHRDAPVHGPTVRCATPVPPLPRAPHARALTLCFGLPMTWLLVTSQSVMTAPAPATASSEDDAGSVVTELQVGANAMPPPAPRVLALNCPTRPQPSSSAPGGPRSPLCLLSAGGAGHPPTVTSQQLLGCCLDPAQAQRPARAQVSARG